MEVFKLRKLWHWLTGTGGIELPSLESITTQHFIVKRKLRAAYEGTSTVLGKGKLWDGQSGTVIMQYMFTDNTFQTGVTYWRYVFWHCALQIMIEAVIEGMGCVVDKHAAPQRHMCVESYSIDATWEIRI